MLAANEIVVCFEGASQAILAEQALAGGGFAVRVMPVPAGIRAGCGFCLRFSPELAQGAVAFLTARGFTGMGIFARDEAAGVSSYRELSPS